MEHPFWFWFVCHQADSVFSRQRQKRNKIWIWFDPYLPHNRNHMFWIFWSRSFFLTNPTVVFSERFESSPEKFVLDPEKMPIAIEINNNIGNMFYTNSSHFKVKASQMTISNINGKKPQLLRIILWKHVVPTILIS